VFGPIFAVTRPIPVLVRHHRKHSARATNASQFTAKGSDRSCHVRGINLLTCHTTLFQFLPLDASAVRTSLT